MSRAALALRLSLLVGLVAGLVVVVVLVGVPSRTQLSADVARHGAWAPTLFALLYAAVSLSPLPKTVFTLVAGAVFGVPEGLLVVVVGATAGALLAFGISRWLGADAVRLLSRRRPRTEAAYDAVAERLERRGLLTILVLRLVPLVPFTALNYVAGVSPVSVRAFSVGTVVGILPATTAYVVVGRYGAHPGSWPFLAAVATLLLLAAAGVVAGLRARATTGERNGRARGA